MPFVRKMTDFVKSPVRAKEGPVIPSTWRCPSGRTDSHGAFYGSGSSAQFLWALIFIVFAAIVFLSPEIGLDGAPCGRGPTGDDRALAACRAERCLGEDRNDKTRCGPGSHAQTRNARTSPRRFPGIPCRNPGEEPFAGSLGRRPRGVRPIRFRAVLAPGCPGTQGRRDEGRIAFASRRFSPAAGRGRAPAFPGRRFRDRLKHPRQKPEDRPFHRCCSSRNPSRHCPRSLRSPGKSAVASQTGRYVTIDFDDVDIRVFIKFVSEVTGRNFLLDERVKGKVTIISPRKIAVDEVYNVLGSILGDLRFHDGRCGGSDQGGSLDGGPREEHGSPVESGGHESRRQGCDADSAASACESR